MVIVYLLVLALLVVIGVFNTKEIRATAREKLAGKWGKAVILILGYFLIALLLGFVSGLFSENSTIAGLLSIAVSVLEVPLSYGLLTSFFKLYNNEEVKAFDFLSYGFSNFGRAWAVSLRVLLKLLVPIVLYIVGILCMSGSLISSSASVISGSSSFGAGSLIFALLGVIIIVISVVWMVIRSYTYEMATYVAIDSPKLSTKEAVERSKEIMPGNRAKLFWLSLSFGGWMVLGIFTLGIGYLWLSAYMQVANVAFYYFVNGKKQNSEAIQETTNVVENNTEA